MPAPTGGTGGGEGPLQNTVALAGDWTVESQKIVAGQGARLLFHYIAPRIYVVAAPPRRRAGTLGVERRRQDGRRASRVPPTICTSWPICRRPGRTCSTCRPAGTTLYSFTFG